MTETVGEFCYSKKDLIGHGAFAVVFKGQHRKKSDFVVAIKVISKKNLSKTQSLLAKEIKILKELHHENVVALFDCQERTSSVFLVMEYCNGGDLADYLQDKGTLSEDTIRLFLQQIASAMCTLQSKGIVHRDLKPQNLLLSHSGVPNPSPSDIKVKIADFGFARFLPGEMMAATLCGSPMYMAPEVIMSKAYDARADLWSLGTIVYQCLTGKAPFQASSPQALKKFYEKNKNACPNIPAGTSSHLKQLLVGLLKRNPKDRMDFGEFFAHPFLTGGILHITSTPVAVPCRQRNYSGSSHGTRSSSSSSPSYSAEALGDIRVDLLRRMTPPYDTTGTSPQDPPTVIQVSGERSPYSGNRRIRRSSGTSMSSPPQPPPDEELEPEDFVMVPSNVDVTDGAQKGRVPWDPYSPYNGQSSPSSSSSQPSSMTTPRRATFIIGSPSSSPSSPPSIPRHRTYSVGTRPSPPSPRDTHPVYGQSVPTSTPASRRRRGSSSPGPPPSPSTGSQSSTPIPVPLKSTFTGSPTSPVVLQKTNTPMPPKAPTPGLEQQRGSFPKGRVPVITTTPPKPSYFESSGSPEQSGASALVTAAAKTMAEHPQGLYGITNIGTFKTSPSSLARQDTIGRQTPGTIQRALSCIEQVRGISESSPILAALAKQTNTGLPVPLGTLPEGVEERSLMRVHSSPAILATAAIGLPRNRSFLNTTGAFQFGTPSAALRRHSSGSGTPSRQGLARISPPLSLTPPLLSPIPGSPTKSLQSRDSEEEEEMKPLRGLFTTGSSPSSSAMIGRDIIPFKSLPKSSQVLSMKLSPTDQPVLVSPGTKITRGFSEGSPVSRTSHEVAPCSPEMEGTIALIAPELLEDTLMETEHTDAATKLNFALSFVDAIMDVISARGAPLFTLADSMALRMNESLLTDQIGYISEEFRTAEQLVLYLKALRILSLALRFAQDELKSHRLKPSNAVKNVVNDLNNLYRLCIDKTSQIKFSIQSRSHSSSSDNLKTITANADKLMYAHAMELCQNAALDELFGNPKECREKYETAQLLLQGLESDAQKDSDLALLQKYKIGVDRRLTQLARRKTSTVNGR